MRIAYVLKEPLGSPTGIVDKVSSQTRAWVEAGHDVRIFGLSADGGDALPIQVAHLCTREAGYASRLRLAPILFANAAAWAPDIVYMRYFTYQPGLSHLLRAAPVVVEVNSDDTREIHLTSRRRHLFNMLTRRRVFRVAEALIFVTEELSQSPAYRGLARARTTIANGIDLRTFPQRQTPPPHSSPRLIFMGSPNCPWHGLDKLIDLARSRPAWHFDIIGADRSRASSTPANVIYHGRLAKADYLPLMTRADVAISSLAMHRDGLNEASPLKTRNYLAAGLPTIIGYEDTDFPDDTPFLLKLPNTEKNVSAHLDAIDRFVTSMRGKTVPRESIEHLDWRVKETRRLEFMAASMAHRASCTGNELKPEPERS